MVQKSLSRRRFGSTIAALTTVALAGCSDETADDENDSDENDEFELDDPGELTINLENEDGDPISTGVEVTIAHDEEDTTLHYGQEIQNGQIVVSTLVHTGDHTITVESLDDEFETVEESVTVEEETDEEITIVLEGASGDPDDAD